MRLNCESLQEFALSLPLVQECGPVRNGALRLSTPFLYPNGEHIDVFLEAENQLYGGYSLSDFGRTAHYLRNANSRLESSGRRRDVLHDILTQSGVKMRNGDLFVEIPAQELGQIMNAMLRLTHACMRISEFSVHVRQRASNPFRQSVAKLFIEKNLEYIPDTPMPGKFNNEVRLDFAVYTPQQSSFVLLLAPINEQSSHTASNEVFRKWYDLRDATTPRVTIYNSAAPVRDEDLKRLEDQSKLIAFPAKADRLLAFLHGAAA